MNDDAPSSSIRARPLVVYGAALAFLLAIGAYLVRDFWLDRERAVQEVSRMAVSKSELIGALFGDTLLAADYVLRDIAGHVDPPPHHAPIDAAAFPALTPLLDERLTSVPGLTDLALFDGRCVFIALSYNRQFAGRKSTQDLCRAERHPPGQSLSIQYLPTEKSANREPVILMSRVISSSEGRMQAGVMAVLGLAYAEQFLRTFAVEGNDLQTIVDSHGVLIARNPPIPGTLGGRADPPPELPALDTLEATIPFVGASPLDGRERIFAASPLKRFPFVVLVGYDKARVLRGWRQRAWQFGIGYVLLVLLSVALLRAHRDAVTQRAAMYAVATTDALTGIANRRHLFGAGERELARAARHGSPLSLLMLDIDFFKRVNDRWGHPLGDRVIRNVADLLRGVLRASDLCGRVGGEEFMAILPETDAEGAYALAERLRQAVASCDAIRADDGEVVRHAISVGVATLGRREMTFEQLVHEADGALYQAKAQGRNRVVRAAA